MKKLFSLSLILCMVACLLILPTYAQNTNLFPNGDMEALPTEHGYSFDFGAQWYTVSGDEDTNVHSGTHSLLFDCSDGVMKALLCNVPAAANGFTVDTEYEISFWVKATDGFRGYEFVKLFYAHDGAFTQDYEVAVTPEVGNAYAFANNETNTEGVWEKVTGRFTLNATHGASQEFATDGFRISFAFGTVVSPGKFYIDDITVTKLSTGASVIVDSQTENICFGVDYVLPTPRAEDAANPGADLSDRIRLTVQHFDGNAWMNVDGYVNVPYADGMSFPVSMHGYYRIIYGIEGAGASAQAVKNLNVMDTLQSISLKTDAVSCTVGQVPSFDNLTVKAVYSYTGEVTVPAGSYTVDTMQVDFHTAGTYTATVSFTAPYGGTKTAPLTVTVVEDDDGTDRTSLSLRVDYAKEHANVGFGHHFTLPNVIVTATDEKGRPIDLSSNVTLTVYHGDDTRWNPLDGLTDVKNTAAVRKILIDRHGYYKIVYRVQSDTHSAEAEFRLNVQDTVTDLSTDTFTEPFIVHPGDTIDLSDIRIEGTFSYTGKRALKPGEYTVSPAKAPNDLRAFNVTVKLVGEYDNVTVTKSVTIPFKTVSSDTPIDRTRLELTLPQTEVNISYRLPFVLPDVQAMAILNDGTKQNLHTSVTWTAYHQNADGWGLVATYENVPLAGEGGRDFLPMEHGYYRIIYKITHGSKTKTETLAINIMDTLTEIKADTSKVKTTYAVGEKLDLSGLTVQKILSYTGQSNVPSGEYTVDFSAYNASKVGEYTVTLSYTAEFGGKKTTSFIVSVIDPVNSAKMTILPTKTTYIYGEALDLTGVQASVQFSAAGEQTVNGTELEIVGYDSRVLGAQTVSFYYRDVLAGTMDVTVNDKLFAIDIDANAVKKAYNGGEALDLSGLQVIGVYLSGARRTLTAEEYVATPEGFEGAQTGSYTVRIHAKDAQEPFATFRVDVTAAPEKSMTPVIVTASVIAAVIILGAVVAVIRTKRRKV